MVPCVKHFMKEKWLELWPHKATNKLYAINPDMKPYVTCQLKRKDQVILHRIRIGHSRLTHSYKMDGRGNGPPPLCRFCGLEEISMQHIMLECTEFTNIRSQRYVTNNMKDLFESINPLNIISFLLEARIYELI